MAVILLNEERTVVSIRYNERLLNKIEQASKYDKSIRSLLNRYVRDLGWTNSKGDIAKPFSDKIERVVDKFNSCASEVCRFTSKLNLSDIKINVNYSIDMIREQVYPMIDTTDVTTMRSDKPTIKFGTINNGDVIINLSTEEYFYAKELGIKVDIIGLNMDLQSGYEIKKLLDYCHRDTRRWLCFSRKDVIKSAYNIIIIHNKYGVDRQLKIRDRLSMLEDIADYKIDSELLDSGIALDYDYVNIEFDNEEIPENHRDYTTEKALNAIINMMSTNKDLSEYLYNGKYPNESEFSKRPVYYRKLIEKIKEIESLVAETANVVCNTKAIKSIDVEDEEIPTRNNRNSRGGNRVDKVTTTKYHITTNKDYYTKIYNMLTSSQMLKTLEDKK